MAPDDRPSRWDELPDEILLQILNCMSRSPSWSCSAAPLLSVCLDSRSRCPRSRLATD